MPELHTNVNLNEQRARRGVRSEPSFSGAVPRG